MATPPDRRSVWPPIANGRPRAPVPLPMHAGRRSPRVPSPRLRPIESYGSVAAFRLKAEATRLRAEATKLRAEATRASREPLNRHVASAFRLRPKGFGGLAGALA